MNVDRGQRLYLELNLDTGKSKGTFLDVDGSPKKKCHVILIHTPAMIPVSKKTTNNLAVSLLYM